MENIPEIIKNINDILLYFLPGYICMFVYFWSKSVRCSFEIKVIWSIFISVLIKHFFDDQVEINSLIGLVFGICMSFLSTTQLFENIIDLLFKKTINPNFFKDVFDSKSPMNAIVYLKDGVVIGGQLSIRGEGDFINYITLINYAYPNEEDSGSKPKMRTNSIILLDINNIERMELFYEKDSKVWKSIQTNSKEKQKSL